MEVEKRLKEAEEGDRKGDADDKALGEQMSQMS